MSKLTDENNKDLTDTKDVIDFKKKKLQELIQRLNQCKWYPNKGYNWRK